jgi:hypothetical protein
MKHAREDYQRIQDPAELIPADEPVMLFRAQDELFQEVCNFYARRLLEKYGNQRIHMATVVMAHAALGAKWHRQKMPDM